MQNLSLAFGARSMLRRLYAAYFIIRTRGKVVGDAYVWRKPDRIELRGRASVLIGPDTVIESNLRLAVHNAQVIIGSRCFIGKNATISAFSDLIIGDGSLVGENVSIHTENHGKRGYRSQYTSGPVAIGSDVWIGAGSIILSGVSIGNGATIGAHSVVNRSIPEGATAVGVPARVIQSR